MRVSPWLQALPVFEAGKEYEHGGLSPQECIVPVLTVARAGSAAAPNVTIETVSGKGYAARPN